MDKPVDHKPTCVKVTDPELGAYCTCGAEVVTLTGSAAAIFEADSLRKEVERLRKRNDFLSSRLAKASEERMKLTQAFDLARRILAEGGNDERD